MQNVGGCEPARAVALFAQAVGAIALDLVQNVKKKVMKNIGFVEYVHMSPRGRFYNFSMKAITYLRIKSIQIVNCIPEGFVEETNGISEIQADKVWYVDQRLMINTYQWLNKIREIKKLN